MSKLVERNACIIIKAMDQCKVYHLQKLYRFLRQKGGSNLRSGSGSTYPMPARLNPNPTHLDGSGSSSLVRGGKHSFHYLTHGEGNR